ncbi:CCA tRNA nucleotidyltransferase [Fluviispira multicolorata]|uniref:CCA tRNA nucleotidyltransferase n=1 Tax=Fluviispira multicolorata TaxID=2654512 RepID=UPI001375588B|nr:CCA tRNA nucleotidyltransferase [Fluviispira multicolorata]
MKHKVIFKNKKFTVFSNVRKASIYLAAKQICFILQKNKFEAYIVGGAVRDLLLNPNKIPKDIDIATSATPENIKDLFKNAHFVGQAFGVCLVKQGSHQFEVTTFRKEGKYLDRRRPESVSLGNFIEDSQRRDFTVNSIYYNPSKRLIIDPHEGLKDLRQKVIRCVGLPEDRLHEDALRILRMIRFAANLNFSIDSKSIEAAQKNSDGLFELSKERILLEFQKIKLGKFHIFCTFLDNIIRIKNIFYKNERFLISDNKSFMRNNLALSKIKLDTIYPFYNFLKYFLFNYEFDQKNYTEFLKVFEEWPLTNDDKKACFIFLKCIFYKENSKKEIDIELYDFIFYEYLTQISSLTKYYSRCIFINLSVFIKDNLLKETLYKITDSYSNENKLNLNTEKIVNLVESKNLDKKYISVIIKYIQYIYLKKGIAPKIESIIDFKTDFFKEYFSIGLQNANKTE